jgi:pimeloyl-ACP methyl ester carboxylesterase
VRRAELTPGRTQRAGSAHSVQPARLRTTIDAIARSDRRAMGDAVYEMVTRDLRPPLRRIRAPVLVVLADGPLSTTRTDS